MPLHLGKEWAIGPDGKDNGAGVPFPGLAESIGARNLMKEFRPTMESQNRGSIILVTGKVLDFIRQFVGLHLAAGTMVVPKGKANQFVDLNAVVLGHANRLFQPMRLYGPEVVRYEESGVVKRIPDMVQGFPKELASAYTAQYQAWLAQAPETPSAVSPAEFVIPE